MPSLISKTYVLHAKKTCLCPTRRSSAQNMFLMGWTEWAMKRPAAFVEEEVQVSWRPAFEGRLVAWMDADCPTVSLPDGESAGSESASSSAAPLGTVQRKVLVGKVRDHIVRSCLAQLKIHGSRVLGKNARYQKLFSTLPQDDENLFKGLRPVPPTLWPCTLYPNTRYIYIYTKIDHKDEDENNHKQ